MTEIIYLVVSDEAGNKTYYDIDAIKSIEYGKASDFLFPEDLGNHEPTENAFKITFNNNKTATFFTGWKLSFEGE